MALADPQSITVDAVAQTLNLVSSDERKSIYATSDETYKFTVSHQTSGSRTRRMVRIDKKVIAADPLTAVNAYQSLGVYVVVDEPSNQGFSDSAIYSVVAGFIAWLTEANVLKVLSSQH